MGHSRRFFLKSSGIALVGVGAGLGNVPGFLTRAADTGAIEAMDPADALVVSKDDSWHESYAAPHHAVRACRGPAATPSRACLREE